MQMSDKAKIAQREYKRRWREKNKERLKKYQIQYWERKAAELAKDDKTDEEENK